MNVLARNSFACCRIVDRTIGARRIGCRKAAALKAEVRRAEFILTCELIFSDLLEDAVFKSVVYELLV